MEFKFDQDFHIHSYLSLCSKDPKQSNEAILQYAIDNDLKELCLTNHFWDETIPGASGFYQLQNFEHIQKALPLPQSKEVKFYFGCEADMNKDFKLGISPELFNKFDFILISLTHFHMVGFSIDKEQNCIEEKAKLWVKRFETLLSYDLPFHKIGLAHLACNLMHKESRKGYLQLLNLIPENKMRELFSKASELGIGIELNQEDMSFQEEEKNIVLRMFKIAKECGCKFYFGSDAHHPSQFKKCRTILKRTVQYLNLQESDKYHLKEKNFK